MRQELIDKLINRQKIMDDECFELSIEISRLLNSIDESKQSAGRELIIRVLDNWNNISDSYKNIFTDLNRFDKALIMYIGVGVGLGRRGIVNANVV